MRGLDLNAMGLTEMDAAEMQNTNGGFIPKASSIQQIAEKEKAKEASEKGGFIENESK